MYYQWAGLGAANWNRTFYATFHFLFTIPVGHAVLVNRTIDSNLGDPVTGFIPIYQPSENFWVNCSACSIPRPNPRKAFDRTWNAATYIPGMQNVNVTLRFTGVAVWVFFILPNAAGPTIGSASNTQVNITFDGKYVGNFSHYPDMNSQDAAFNATIFSTSGLNNTSHEVVVGTNDYGNYSYLNFDWAMYTVDINASASPSASGAFPLTTDPPSLASTSSPTPTTDPSAIANTSSPTPTPQSSSSKTGVIVGSTLGGLAVISLLLIFFIRRSRQPPPVRYKKDEGALDIDVHQHHQPYREREIPVLPPTQSKAARLREERQREIDQRNLDNSRSIRNAGSIDETGGASAASTSRPSPELASLRNEMLQLRDRVDYLQSQNEPLPPAYTQPSDNM